MYQYHEITACTALDVFLQKKKKRSQAILISIIMGLSLQVTLSFTIQSQILLLQ